MRGVEAKWQQRPHCASRVKRRPEQVSKRRRKLQLEREAVREARTSSLRPRPSSEASSRGQILIVKEGGVKPRLGEQTHGTKHTGEVATLQHKL